MLKKLLLSFLIGLTFLFSIVPYFTKVKAQTTWYNQSFQEWYGKVYDPSNPSEIFGERYTAAQVQWIFYSMFSFIVNSATGPQNAGLIQCFISNTANINTCVDQLKNLLQTKTASSQDSSTLASEQTQKQSLLSLVFDTSRPISGIGYIKEKFQKVQLVPVAHAQTVGFGFTMLQPVQEMWVAIRNISFGLFVIASVILAFMIMFRVKLSPQTVITIQSALPKIVVALILVTFSYAIAGFLIDLMYVVIGFVSLAFSPLAWNMPATTIFNFLTKGQPLSINFNLGFLVMGLIYVVLFILFLFILLILSFGLVATAFAGVTTFAILSVVASTGIGSIILILIVIFAAIIVVWHFFRIMWNLVQAFASVILLTIFAPLQITAGIVIPNFGFGSWLRNFVSVLSTFVVTGVLALLSFVFLFRGITIGVHKYAPDLSSGIGNALFGVSLSSSSFGNEANSSANWPPLLGGGNSGPTLGLLYLMVSFVIFSLIPKATELVKSFIQGKPFTYGTAIGEAFGPIKGAYGMTIAPAISGFQKYSGEYNATNLLRSANTAMQSGGLRWVPQSVKDYVAQRAAPLKKE